MTLVELSPQLAAPATASVSQPKPAAAARSPLADSIAEQLETLSIKLYDVLYRTKDFSDPVLDRLVKGFKTIQGDDGREFDWDSCVYELTEGESRFIRKEVIHVSTEVDELKGRATVWLTLRVSKHHETSANQFVSVLSWERRREQWMCVKRMSMRGLGDYF